MSQSSIDDQVKEFESVGFPVRKGTRGIAREGNISPEQFGSDLWHSRWVHNVFENYPVLMKSVGAKFLCDAAKGVTAFVVGVGPSLDESVKQLKEAKGRALVISTDAAVRALLANGVTPDLVVSFDCKADQSRLWEGVTEKIPCLFNSCTHPESIKTWPGPVLFFNQFHTQDELCNRILPDVLPHLGQLPSAGTVGNMAVLAAHLLGCDSICCVGMDFCYAPTDKGGWRYRAQDYKQVNHEWLPVEIKELYDNDERVSRSFMVKGENGKEFKSDPELVFYQKSFADLMPHFKVPIVNCSPDGMIPSQGRWVLNERDSVDHTYKKMSVSQAINEFCKAELQEGRTIVKHLGKVIPDPRALS